MNTKFLGDSYDLVKRSLIAALGCLGPWAVHPMFTEDVSEADAQRYSALVGAPLLTRAPFTAAAIREQYLACCAGASNLFLDPDTGLRFGPLRPSLAPRYLLGSELISLARARSDWITLVFDQSLPRGAGRAALERKLALLAAEQLSAIAYWSHASFLIVSASQPKVALAHSVLADVLEIPQSHLLSSAV